MEIATFAGGCFWCLEAAFQRLRGVESAVSGYMGGRRERPSYEQVCSGASGHAEVVQVVFDPEQIRYDELLSVFFALHDPTTLNRQGHDIGTQYRSAVFCHTPEQRTLAQAMIARLTAEAAFPSPIVTEITEAATFWPAEDYHQGYFERNPNQPYCQAVVAPKLAKFKNLFAQRLKG
ncbi:MAG: peptide-methionine (S)-S-oxide reductase MsrA [Betaproteobacteria bacterium]|nr:peptide-methionine (S)-S-oxide reductase MsrA [Betaproteobacteria bacterium]